MEIDEFFNAGRARAFFADDVHSRDDGFSAFGKYVNSSKNVRSNARFKWFGVSSKNRRAGAFVRYLFRCRKRSRESAETRLFRGDNNSRICTEFESDR